MRGFAVRVMGVLFAAVMASACQTAGYDAGIESNSFMTASATNIAPPAGFISFCLKNPDQCAVADNQAQIVQLDERTWDILQAVNDQYNRAITMEDDMEHFGRAELWTISQDGYGDCEDYALTKRKALIQAGLPARALRLAVVRTRNNVGHAVLTVATDRGDFVLDNISAWILPWEETGYTWISRQDAVNPMGWVSLRRGYGQTASTAAIGTTLAAN